MDARSANVVETLASLSLFGDLSYPELEAVAHTFEEEAFAKDQRVLRQDVSGGSFYVILTGEARVVIDGEERATLSRGDFFGEISVLTDTAADGRRHRGVGAAVPRHPRARPQAADARADRASPIACFRSRRDGCARPTHGPGRRAALPARRPTTSSSSAAAPAASRSRTPWPAPGISRCAVISRDEQPGGMFRRFPVYQRLISWTKPDAPCRARDPRVRVVRPQQPPRRRREPSGAHAALHGPRARPPRPCRDGGCARRVRRTRRRPGSLRMRMGVDPQRGRRLRARDLRRRVPLPRVRVRSRDDRSLEAADPRPRRRRRITRTPGPRSDTKEKTSSSSASGTRASRSPRASSRGRGRSCWPHRGPVDTAVLAFSPLRLRYLQPFDEHVRGGSGQPRRRRLDRARRASRGRIPDPRPRDDLAGRAHVRGRRCDRRDRVPRRPSATSPTSALPRSTTDGSRRRRRTGRASPCRASSSPGT